MEWYIWLILSIGFVALEIITPSFIVLWLSVGAFYAMLTTFITNQLIIQLVVFVIISVISMFFTKKLFNDTKNKIEYKNSTEMLIGKEVIVVKRINTDIEFGEIKIGNDIWTAYSDKDIDVGELVKIIKIDGAKVFVDRK